MGIYGDEPRGHKPAIIPTQKDLQNMKAKERDKKKQENKKQIGGWWTHWGKIEATLKVWLFFYKLYFLYHSQ